MTQIEASAADRKAAVGAAMAAASKAAGRPIGDTQLVAISKTRTAEEIEAFIDLGQRVFGENRVQETAAKWPTLRNKHAGLTLHLVGPLQTNKVKQAIGLFDVIETLDREKLAKALAAAKPDNAALPQLYIQVNTGQEPQKAGIAPAELADFVTFCRDLDLPIAGLMCIPPVDEAAGPHFALLGKLAAAHHLSYLSMGMSADYPTAIGLGATHIRLGTALFGPRPAA